MALDDPFEWAYTEQVRHDHRITILMSLLVTWYLSLRHERPSLQQRARWARRYVPEIEMYSGTPQLPCMCTRYQPGEWPRIEDHFSAKVLRAFNDGSATVHPKEPGWDPIDLTGLDNSTAAEGFGAELLMCIVPQMLGGNGERTFGNDQMVYRLKAPLDTAASHDDDDFSDRLATRIIDTSSDCISGRR